MAFQDKSLGIKGLIMSNIQYQLKANLYGSDRVFTDEINFSPEDTAITVMHCAEQDYSFPDFPGLEEYLNEWMQRKRKVMNQNLAPLFETARSKGFRILYLISGYDQAKKYASFKKIKSLAEEKMKSEAKHQTNSPLDFSYCKEKGMELWNDSIEASINDFIQCSSVAKFPDSITPQNNDWLADTAFQAHTVLGKYGIKKLLLTGFDACGCLLTSPGGMFDMVSQGYQCVVLEDCVEAAETPATLADKLIKTNILKTMQLLGLCSISTSSDFFYAVNQESKRCEL